MRPTHFFPFFAALSVFACGGAQQGGDDPATAPATGTQGLHAQEWGTYTSVQGSDGVMLGGVHHEDEVLPAWVHRRNWTDHNNYYFEELPEEPLQQLETPVIYFWSDEARSLRVEVGFPEGVVGQWYPEAATFAPAIDACTEVAGGTMAWDVHLDPSIEPSTFSPVEPTEIWAPSRQVASTPLSVTTPSDVEEREQFIFYRGLGKFVAPIRATATDDDRIHVQNESPDEVRAAFVLRVTGDHGQIVPLGAVAAGQTLDAAVPGATLPLAGYVADAQTVLRGALEESGLSPEVAKAMVDTWTRSWFQNAGLRVLYLAPRAWTDGWLPTRITPAPESYVRTLVGRIETLSPADERALVGTLRDHASTQAPLDPATLGRFAEPRLRRAFESLGEPGERAFAQSTIDAAHALP